MSDDLVTLTRDEYNALAIDAEAWRALWRSPHVRDLLAEWHEWRRRQDLSASTSAMAALENWQAVATAPTYAELERRRNTYTTPALTPDQIKAKAAASWAPLNNQEAAA